MKWGCAFNVHVQPNKYNRTNTNIYFVDLKRESYVITTNLLYIKKKKKEKRRESEILN